MLSRPRRGHEQHLCTILTNCRYARVGATLWEPLSSPNLQPDSCGRVRIFRSLERLEATERLSRSESDLLEFGDPVPRKPGSCWQARPWRGESRYVLNGGTSDMGWAALEQWRVH